MRIRDLEIFVVEPPPPGWGGRYWIFTKLTTDDGLTGYGEVYASTVGPAAMTAVIEDVFERHMLGERPENIEVMFRRAYSSGFSQRPDPTVIGAFSGLEIACWDILGKALERPVHSLLGGLVNRRIRSYSYLYPRVDDDPDEFWMDPHLSAECAAEMVELGVHRGQVRSGRPLHDSWWPATFHGGHWSIRGILQTDPRGSWSQGRHPVRNPWPVHGGRGNPAWVAGWRNSIHCGLKNRSRRTTPKPWREWPGLSGYRLLRAND